MEIPNECPFRGLCLIVSEPEKVMDLSPEKAEGLYSDFDVLRTRHINETIKCRRINGSLCWMTLEHQREFVGWFEN